MPSSSGDSHAWRGHRLDGDGRSMENVTEALN